MRTCTKCGEGKSIEGFYRDSSRPDGFRSDCKACYSAGLAERKKDPAYAAKVRRYSRDYQRRRALERFGLSQVEYDAMEAAQGGRCAICELKPDLPGPNGKTLHIDHDHETGEVRMLLCTRCNTLLGMAQDDPGRLRAAARYLEVHARSMT